MPKPIRISRHFNATVERVFEVMTDFRAAPQRIPAIKKVEVLTDGPVGKGTRFRETRIMFGREATETMEVTEFDPPHSLTVGGNSCGTIFASRFRFRPSGSGTELEMELTTKPVSMFAKLMSPLAAFMMGPMKKAMSADIDAIQKVCERGE